MAFEARRNRREEKKNVAFQKRVPLLSFGFPLNTTLPFSPSFQSLIDAGFNEADALQSLQVTATNCPLFAAS